MNNARRKAIDALIWRIEEIKSELDTIWDQEQETFDAIPDSLQSSERGQASEDAIGNLNAALIDLDNAIDSLREAKGES